MSKPWHSIATTYVHAYMRTRLGWDSFTRTETDQWGNADTATSTQAWALLFGPAAQLSVNGSAGITSCNSVNATRGASLPVGEHTDIETVVDVLVPVTPATAGIRTLHIVRMQDSSNYYYARVEVTTASAVQVSLRKNVAGSDSQIAAAVTVDDLTHSTTVPLTVRCGVAGEEVRAKVWLSTDDEPDDWQITCVDPSIQVGSSIGFAGILATGNTNSLPVGIQWDNVTAYSPAQWTDITERVLIAQGLGSPITGAIGRQTELDTIDPSNLSFALKNLNNWLTPDSTVSPYWPDWKTGTPLRWSETIGARSFAFPDMWLEIPEVTVSFEKDGANDRTMHLNAVDLLTRLNRAPVFVSNLGEYIKYNATEGALRGYWPLTDPSGATYANSAGPISQEPLRFTRVDSYSPVGFVDSLVNFGSQDGPPGDDGPAVEFTSTAGTNQWARLANSAVTNSEPGETGVATLVVWVYVPDDVTTLDQLALARDLATFDIAILLDPLGGSNWMATFGTATGSDTALTGGVIKSGWHLLGGQVDFASGDISFWVDVTAVTGNTGGSGTSGKSLDRLVLDGGENTSPGLRMAHCQLYLGDSDAFTREHFLAQYDAGFNGFGQQTVDQRIRQIANYAGLGDGQLDLEESDSLIQAPAFAGARPGTLASSAATTGGGILFTRGSELVYHDRKHRFNL